MKVVQFEDKDIKFAMLSSGKYLVDGEVVKVDGYHDKKVKVIDENNIRKIRDHSIIDYYLNIETDEKISEYDYSYELNKLYEKCNEDEYSVKWESLEDEFKYKKFKLIHKPIYKEVQTLSDPLMVEIITTKYDTNNKFIKNAYLNGKGKIDLFEYNQNAAWLNIVSECFKELKMEFADNCSYSATQNKKIWGNSTHSCIRYVVAFGTYVFNDDFKNPYTLSGTLEDMVKRYEYDRNKIRKIIKTKYNNHFGHIDEDKVDFVKVIKDLYALRESINSIESKKATWTNQNQANKRVNEIIDYLESKYE